MALIMWHNIVSFVCLFSLSETDLSHDSFNHTALFWNPVSNLHDNHMKAGLNMSVKLMLLI